MSASTEEVRRMQNLTQVQCAQLWHRRNDYIWVPLLHCRGTARQCVYAGKAGGQLQWFPGTHVWHVACAKVAPMTKEHITQPGMAQAEC